VDNFAGRYFGTIYGLITITALVEAVYFVTAMVIGKGKTTC